MGNNQSVQRPPSPTTTPWSSRDQQRLLADLGKVTATFTIAPHDSDGSRSHEERVKGDQVDRLGDTIEYTQFTVVQFKKGSSPSGAPTATPPTAYPTADPSSSPSGAPTDSPTASPSTSPTTSPTDSPTDGWKKGKITCVHDLKPEGIVGHVDSRKVTFRFDKPLGGGGFGNVFEGTFDQDGRPQVCALKQIHVDSWLENRCLNDHGRSAILREWQLAKRRALCPNVMRPWGYFVHRDVVLPLCPFVFQRSCNSACLKQNKVYFVMDKMDASLTVILKDLFYLPRDKLIIYVKQLHKVV